MTQSKIGRAALASLVFAFISLPALARPECGPFPSGPDSLPQLDDAAAKIAARCIAEVPMVRHLIAMLSANQPRRCTSPGKVRLIPRPDPEETTLKSYEIVAEFDCSIPVNQGSLDPEGPLRSGRFLVHPAGVKLEISLNALMWKRGNGNWVMSNYDLWSFKVLEAIVPENGARPRD
jgi:hypothetical protein